MGERRAGALGGAGCPPAPRPPDPGRRPGQGVGLALAADAVASDGHVVGVDPSATMRELAADRCAPHIAAGRVELRDGTAEHVLGVPPERLRAEATAAGFADLGLTLRSRRLNSPAVELLARKSAR